MNIIHFIEIKIILFSQFIGRMSIFMGIVFQTISAVGSHAALPHYTATPESAKQITTKEIYLVDSGGQYLGMR